MKYIKLIFGYCESCRKWFKYPYKSHIGTAYLNEKDNYVTACKTCHERFNYYVHDQWCEYNRERGC